jgi:CRISPR-associated exonuclease Cas4
VDLLLALVAFLILVAVAAWAIYRARNPSGGRIVTLDLPGKKGETWYSSKYGLVGRPDEIRYTTRAETIPVEIKSNARSPRTPYRSHALQVTAYCLLAEDKTGVAPPYGLLVYGDGTEWKIHWDAAARDELNAEMIMMRSPYQGETTATYGKCQRCRYASICDGARSVGVAP